ncbi:UNVERIFIED_CONTAM: hypothetical protein FKN15_036076 [Acipenser sinensis]
MAHEIYTDLIDDACLGLCFEVHRAVKCGYFLLDETDPESIKDFEIVDQPGVDIFGQVYNQWKNKECVCPNCNRSIAASRFAPHLEKCLGMGRNSSRIANRRIASSNNMNKSESDQEDNDDINDNDWSYGSEKKAKKRKSDKYTYNSGINYETLGPEELRSLLTTQCGVISEHTKKMCTRSFRCPQHTDEQRQTVRVFLLGPSALTELCLSRSTLIPGGKSLLEPETSVENDSYDPSENQDLMSRLQWDGSSDISPSDSASSKASTNNSESKKPKKKKPHLGLSSGSGSSQQGLGGSSSKKPPPKLLAPPTPSIYTDIN